MFDATAGREPAPSAGWICALHTDLLGRGPDLNELARWHHDARAGASHRELAERFLRSEDYCSHEVGALYRGLLDGDGDPTAVGAWTRSLQSGAPLQDVVTGLCDSFEYRTRHPPPATFVESLYQRLLRRAPDAEGQAGWLRALGERASTLSVIRGFVRSTEYCSRQLTELHVRLLGREPDRPRLLPWIVAAVQGTALQHFVLEIVTSAEYIARAAGRDPAPSADPDGHAIASGGGEVAGGAQHLLRLLLERHDVVVDYGRPERPASATPRSWPATSLPPMCTR